MQSSDTQAIADAFASWNKAVKQFEEYWAENEAGGRTTLLAVEDGKVIGYGNLLIESYYAPFKISGIPEINDLNVVIPRQGRGIGRKLIAALEDLAREKGFKVIGIGVGLGPDYKFAQGLYPRLGYVPDGRGVHKGEWEDEIYFTKAI
jgi:GNAT superfamily N-acetyltransferase